MQVSKTLIALAAAGLVSSAFAQGAAPAATSTEKKVEAPKAAEPAKIEVAKNEPAKEGVKPVKHVKKTHKEHKVETKTEAVAATPAK